MSTSSAIHDNVAGRRSARRPAVLALVGAIVFVGCYLLVDVVKGAVETSSQPLPNDPDNDIYRYLVDNSAAVAMTAGMQLLSMVGLLLFIINGRGGLALPDDSRVNRGHAAGLLAVVAMTVSVALSMVLAATASTMSVGTAVTLNTASFIAGGVTHVVCLGIFALLTSRAHTSRPVRIVGVVAAVPALLSLISLVWFYGSAFILLGRLLCMAWSITTAVSLVRGGSSRSGARRRG